MSGADEERWWPSTLEEVRGSATYWHKQATDLQAKLDEKKELLGFAASRLLHCD